MKAGAGPKDRLTEENRQFSKSLDPSLLKRLVGKHELSVAILACSDARVCPEKVFNLSLGDAYVVRVAGNTPSDPKIVASLEHAVQHLGVSAPNASWNPSSERSPTRSRRATCASSSGSSRTTARLFETRCIRASSQ